MEYVKHLRERMREICSVQYDEVKILNHLMASFLRSLKVSDKRVLRFYITWLKFALDDLSMEILPPLREEVCQKRKALSDYQEEHDEKAVKECQKKLIELDQQLINASFGIEHLFRELGQIYEAVATFEDVRNPSCVVTDLPRIAAQLLFDGFPLELLDGDAAHMPKEWIHAVLICLDEILREAKGFEPKMYVLSVLGIQSSGKSTLLNTVFGVQFSVSAG